MNVYKEMPFKFDKIVSFKSQEGTEFFVDSKFFNRFQNHPSDYSNYELINNNITNFLHNESGPAMIHNGVGTYFLKGQLATEYDIKRITFNKKIENFLDED